MSFRSACDAVVGLLPPRFGPHGRLQQSGTESVANPEGRRKPAPGSRCRIGVVRSLLGLRPSSLAGLGLRHPWSILLTWVVIAVGVTVAGWSYGGTYENEYRLPSTESAEAAQLIEARTEPEAGYPGQLVLHDPDGLDEHDAALRAWALDLRGDDPVIEVSDPLADASLSDDGTTSLVHVRLAESPGALSPVERRALDRATDDLPPSVEGVWAGGLGDVLERRGGHRTADLLGLGAALLVLVLMFGSLAAAAVPLVASVCGVAVGISLLGLLASSVTLSTSSPALATMIGLGCGIDYALFLVTRSRQLMYDGLEPSDAVHSALRSTGPAVLTAASTVAIALLGLYASGVPLVARLGLAAVVTLATAALAAVTLTPAVLVLLGSRIDRVTVGRRARAEGSPSRGPLARHARFVTRHPVPVVVVSALALIALAAPMMSLRLGHLDESVDRPGTMSRTAHDLTSAAFGPGATTEVVALLRFTTPPSATDLALVESTIAAQPAVAEVSHFVVDDGIASATVVPATGSQDPATADLVEQLRGPVADQVERSIDADLLVSGQTAAQVDLIDRMRSRTPLVVVLVVLTSFLLLAFLLRSPVVAAKAAAMNLISIGASYGVLVAVFQWQWGSALFGLDQSVPIESFVPLLMFVIVFGLSMDYEIFLISRIRHEWTRTRDNRSAVRVGLVSTSRVISAAGAIMVCVFLAFTRQDDVVIAMLAFGLAVSVAIDVTVVRLLLVPATMVLLGRANWWTPAGLLRRVRAPRRGPRRPTARPGHPAE